mgnify:FL=1
MEEEFEPPTHRMVNGERVELTPEEVAEILAQWQIEREKQNLNNE